MAIKTSRKSADTGKTTARKSRKRKTNASKRGAKRWSAKVMWESNALDLESGVFTWSDPRKIAASLKRSADRSRRRKAEPYRSALSMLVFYINRGGRNLSARRKRLLEQAKVELRRQYGHT